MALGHQKPPNFLAIVRLGNESKVKIPSITRSQESCRDFMKGQSLHPELSCLGLPALKDHYCSHLSDIRMCIKEEHTCIMHTHTCHICIYSHIHTHI